MVIHLILGARALHMGTEAGPDKTRQRVNAMHRGFVASVMATANRYNITASRIHLHQAFAVPKLSVTRTSYPVMFTVPRINRDVTCKLRVAWMLIVACLGQSLSSRVTYRTVGALEAIAATAGPSRPESRFITHHECTTHRHSSLPVILPTPAPPK